MFFSVITKNLSLEILTKNLLTFKRRDGSKMKPLIFLGFTEKSNFQMGQGKGFKKKQYRGEDCLKRREV